MFTKRPKKTPINEKIISPAPIADQAKSKPTTPIPINRKIEVSKL